MAAPPPRSDTTNDTLTRLPEKQIAHGVEVVFTVCLAETSPGHWEVREDAALTAGVDVSSLAVIASRLNSAQHLSDSSEQPGGSMTTNHRFGSWAWGKRVINFVVPGASATSVHGGITAWLAQGTYAQVASHLIRVVGPRALLGGGIGLVSYLAAGVAWSSTPWAS